MIRKSKYFWYLVNIVKLSIVCVRVFIYCLFRPKKFFELFFSFFSTINEFYQVSHGRLFNFEETKLFQGLKKNLEFVEVNYFLTDNTVSRSVENQVLSSLVKYLNPRTVFEIGTYQGFTTLHFAHNTEDNAVIYTMDLPPDFGKDVKGVAALNGYSYDDLKVVELSQKGINNRYYQNDPLKKKVREIYGDSLSFDFSPYYEKIDLVFIDGNHSYNYVKSDTENALKMISKSGIILWHDYDYIIHRDIFKYLNSLVGQYKIYSIPNTRFAVYGPQLV